MSQSTAPHHQQKDETTELQPIKLGQRLVRRGLITEAQLEEALAHQKDRAPRKLIGQTLVELGYLSEADRTAIVAETVGVPFAHLRAAMVQPGAMDALGREFLEQHNLLPLSQHEGWLTIAAEDYTDVFLIEQIRHRSGCRVQLVAATAENIREIRETLTTDSRQRLDAPNEDGPDALIHDVQEAELTVVEDQDEDVPDLEVAASDSPVIKLVNHLIRRGVEVKASDIHLESDENACRVRYRVDGRLEPGTRIPPRSAPAVVSRIKIMAKMDISERRTPQDGQITVMVEGRSIELRVSTMPTKFGETVVMRIVDEQNVIADLNKLGFQAAMLHTWREVLQEANGVVLVTGPTGSGKSTTLYASLMSVAEPAINVCTVEDPIEHNLQGINQFEINPRTGFTFPSALRALVRQDPNVIMVGEVRDAETAKLATEAALTGHLVFTTLHTNDAVSAITRLTNMGVEPYLIAAALRCVIAQRLVRRLCPHCRQAVSLTPAGHAIIERILGRDAVPEATYVAHGCSQCRGTGSIGRVGVYELLRVDEAFCESVAQGANLQQLRRQARRQHYTTLYDDGLQKVAAGLISFDALLEALGKVEGPAEAPDMEDTATLQDETASPDAAEEEPLVLHEHAGDSS